jgi:hypothetical protein
MVIPKSDYKLFISEAVGTALPLFCGLNIVIFNWGEGSIVAKLIPSELTRTILTGFMFGCVGCLVSLSPVGNKWCPYQSRSKHCVLVAWKNENECHDRLYREPNAGSGHWMLAFIIPLGFEKTFIILSALIKVTIYIDHQNRNQKSLRT